MRLAIIICGFVLVANPAFAQRGNVPMPAPTPEPMLMRSAPQAPKPVAKGVDEIQVQNHETDRRFDHQVNATQQLIQAEERRLQSQFAQIEKLRSAAIDKQDQKELERLQRVEQQVVAEYQKRVEQILLGAQAQIQATTVHVPAPQTQSQQPQAAQQPAGSSRTQPQVIQNGQTRPQSTGAASSQAPQQQSRQPSQNSQKSSSSRSVWSYWRR